jgi:hypothetical protein
VPGHAVMGEQGLQEGTEHPPLKGPCVEDQRGICVVTYPYHLGVETRTELKMYGCAIYSAFGKCSEPLTFSTVNLILLKRL